MTTALRPLSRLILGLFIIAGIVPVVSVALAQDEDQILKNYLLGMENLHKAVSLMPTDSLQSTDALERASQALRFLSGSSSSTDLVAQLENTFERAEETIQNQSQADLGVQVTVLKGGFQRLVYEASVSSANQGDIASTQNRLAKLASNIGLAPDIQNALLAENDPNKLFARFEVAAANVVKAHLGNVLGLLETDKGIAYQTLATAYSDFLIVQDSPRADTSTNTIFTESFPLLIADDREALGEAINQLNRQMDSFAAAANALVEGTPSTNATPTQSVTATQSEVSTTTESTTTEAANTEAVISEERTSEATATETATTETSTNEATVNEATVTTTPASNTSNTLESTAETTSAETTTAQATTTEASTASTSSTATPATQAPTTARSVANPFETSLSNELKRLNVPANQQAALSERWLEGGFTSVQSVVNDLLAKTSLAMSAVQGGNQGFAKTQLAEAQAHYTNLLSPLVRDATLDSSVTSLLSSLSSSPSLRQQDLATLNQQWAGVAKSLNLRAPATDLQGLSNGVTSFWSGWPRMIIMIVLSLLAFVPLYLLFLAFGGGNRNWQLIGYALFLLLLPVIYEGLSFVLSLINSFVNVTGLEILSRFSFFQNPVMQVVWAALTGIAIVLASLGLYGICVQFGLLGKRQDDLSRTMIETSPSVTSIEKAKTTNFEWDEEF
ncbi:MAG: hypothetical protein ACRCYY_19430 [Trueperaceae bacterium]